MKGIIAYVYNHFLQCHAKTCVCLLLQYFFLGALMSYFAQKTENQSAVNASDNAGHSVLHGVVPDEDGIPFKSTNVFLAKTFVGVLTAATVSFIAPQQTWRI